MIFENDTQSQPNNNRRQSRIVNPTPYSGLGKLPPQAVDLEEAILGALLLERESFLIVGEFLKAEMFYKDNHQKIFTAIQTLFTKGSPIDILTVRDQLRNQGELEMIGGAYYITGLTSHVASSANIEFHAKIVYQKFLQREMIRISTDTIQAAYDDMSDVFEIHNTNQTELFNLFIFTNGRNIDTIETLVNESIAEILEDREAGLTGVGSGFYEVDNLTNGWQKSNLIIVAARPAMGKTAFVMKCARNAAVEFNKPVAVFSIEMSKRELAYRMISDETEISLDNIQKRRLSDYEKLRLKTATEKLRRSPLHVDDTPALSIEIFRSKCIRLKKKFDIQLIIIDYLQLMTISGKKTGNREQEISKISAALKSIAKELNVPVIALSQLSRAVESRPGMGKRPMLSDLRESGSIEQDADMVLMLYRPEYYDITEDGDGNSVIGLTELICAKYRHGATGTVKLKFIGKYTRFTDWIDKPIDEYKIQPSVMFNEPRDKF